MTTSPGRDETPVYALIAPDGDLTWHSMKDEPAVQKTIGGSYGPGCTTTASVDYPALRLVANDVAALDASGEFLPNPAAEQIITALSGGRITQPWRGHVALVEYDVDPHTSEVGFPTPMTRGYTDQITRLHQQTSR